MNLFSYSEAQLSAIFATIDLGGLSVSAFDLDELESAVDSFLDETFPGPTERVREYQEIAKAAQHLRTSLAILDDEKLSGLARSIEVALCTIENHARDQEFFWKDADPKARFYWRVLDCWRAAGGVLGYSRNGDPPIVGGPTVRYFEAAVGPVMGGDDVPGRKMPGREAIAKIIKRHKVLDRELEALEAVDDRKD